MGVSALLFLRPCAVHGSFAVCFVPFGGRFFLLVMLFVVFARVSFFVVVDHRFFCGGGGVGSPLDL